MGIGFSYWGRSGKPYHYALLNLANPSVLTMPWAPGIVIFAKDVPHPFYIAQGHNIGGVIAESPFWAALKAGGRAPLAYIHPIDDEREREAEFQDILQNPAYDFSANSKLGRDPG